MTPKAAELEKLKVVSLHYGYAIRCVTLSSNALKAARKTHSPAEIEALFKDICCFLILMGVSTHSLFGEAPEAFAFRQQFRALTDGTFVETFAAGDVQPSGQSVLVLLSSGHDFSKIEDALRRMDLLLALIRRHREMVKKNLHGLTASHVVQEVDNEAVSLHVLIPIVFAHHASLMSVYMCRKLTEETDRSCNSIMLFLTSSE